MFDYVICLLGSRAYIYIYMCVFFLDDVGRGMVAGYEGAL